MIESPIKESKEVYLFFINARIEALSEIHNLLLHIAISPDNTDLRKQLTEVAFSPKVAYIDEADKNDLILLSTQAKLDEKILLLLQERVGNSLRKIINKIYESNSYYLSYSSLTPWKKTISFIRILMNFLLSLSVIFTVIYGMFLLFSLNNFLGIIVFFIFIVAFVFYSDIKKLFIKKN